MTGVYLRAQRNGKWDSLEIDDMSDEELDAYIASARVEDGWRFAKHLAQWIRDEIRPQFMEVTEGE